MTIKNLKHDAITHKCDMCKKDFDAYHYVIEPRKSSVSLYDDAEITISLGKRGGGKVIILEACPECMSKLLDILDNKFPRLNLEDEVVWVGKSK